MHYRQNIITIDLKQIADNYFAIKKTLPISTSLLAVIKADAYGHGLIPVAQKLESINCDGFCVAIVEEGVILRKAGIQSKIFILGIIGENSILAALEQELIICVSSFEYLNIISKYAKQIRKTAYIHIAVNTGMNRIGINNRDELLKIYQYTLTHPHIHIVTSFTHLAFADEHPNEVNFISNYTQKQVNRYLEITKDIPIPKSLSNSAGITRLDNNGYDYARAGIILYGYPPVKTEISVKPCMEWRSEVMHIMAIRKGDTVGYGRTFTAEKDMLIASVAVGYGDGYFRSLSNKAKVIINGKYAKLLGRVCMDQIIIDVTDVQNAKVGDSVILLGEVADKKISAEDMAQWAGTISYEILLSPSQRVTKEYKNIS